MKKPRRTSLPRRDKAPDRATLADVVAGLERQIAAQNAVSSFRYGALQVIMAVPVLAVVGLTVRESEWFLETAAFAVFISSLMCLPSLWFFIRLTAGERAAGRACLGLAAGGFGLAMGVWATAWAFPLRAAVVFANPGPAPAVVAELGENLCLPPGAWTRVYWRFGAPPTGDGAWLRNLSAAAPATGFVTVTVPPPPTFRSRGDKIETYDERHAKAFAGAAADALEPTPPGAARRIGEAEFRLTGVNGPNGPLVETKLAAGPGCAAAQE